MKITKAEWDRFWVAIGKNWYLDDTDMSPEDESGLAAGDVITFSFGAIGWQGRGEPKPNGIVQARDIVDGGRSIDLGLPTAIKRWQKAQTTATVAVEIPKDKADALAEAVKALGGKVLTDKPKAQKEGER